MDLIADSLEHDQCELRIGRGRSGGRPLEELWSQDVEVSLGQGWLRESHSQSPAHRDV